MDASAGPSMHGVWERIVHGARIEFSLKGFNGAQMEAIARKADVSKPSVYYYFASKEHLYRETIHFFAASLLEDLKDADFDSMDAARGLKRFYEIIYDFYGRAPFMAQIAIDFYFQADCVRKSGKMTRYVFGVYERLVDRAVQNGRISPDLDKVAHFSFASFLIVSSFVNPRAGWGLGEDKGPMEPTPASRRQVALNAVYRMFGLDSERSAESASPALPLGACPSMEKC